jgi:hypothetical protein
VSSSGTVNGPWTNVIFNFNATNTLTHFIDSGSGMDARRFYEAQRMP